LDAIELSDVNCLGVNTVDHNDIWCSNFPVKGCESNNQCCTNMLTTGG